VQHYEVRFLICEHETDSLIIEFWDGPPRPNGAATDVVGIWSMAVSAPTTNTTDDSTDAALDANVDAVSNNTADAAITDPMGMSSYGTVTNVVGI
jgi:hypothetical protein